MKRIQYKVFPLILLLVFSTCNEEFLEVENKNNLAAENWYQTKTDFELAINSCYSGLMDVGMFGLQFQLLFGAFSDRLLWETTGNDRIIITTSDGNIYNVWRGLYFGVFRSSKLLRVMKEKSWEDIELMDEDTYIYMRGQAKGIRALSQFYLVTLFNNPIFYNEDNIPEDYLVNLTNGTQQQFWDQIEKDLTEAIPDLKLKSQLAEKDFGRVTRGGARALLAKAMLYKHYHYYCKNGQKGSAEDIADLQIAREQLEAIVSSGEYSLVQPLAPKTKSDYLNALLSNSSYLDLSSENNSYKSEYNQESLWEVSFTNDQARNNNYWLPGWLCPGEMCHQYFGPHTAAYKNLEVHPVMYYEFEEATPELIAKGFERDPRCDASIYFPGDSMDFRPESEYYDVFSSRTGTKRIASGRNIPGVKDFESIGIQKYYYPVFYEGIGAPLNSPVNKRVIRYADVLLMYAEVMHLLGNNGPGLDALNEVRARVDMPPIPALTKEAIVHERDIEFAFEHARWLDLIRWSFDPEWGINWDELEWGIDENNSINPFEVGKNEYFPIPRREIELSEGALKQNPGW